jgi:translation initiation factor eIF-2B subunit alpha
VLLQLGTYQVAMIAKTLRKPLYVAVESYKFARMYPLSQRDVEDMVGFSSSGAASTSTAVSATASGEYKDLQEGKITKLFPHATVDFTPAKYITLLFTDLGVLTPAAVSDELIRLYQ